MIAPLFGVLAVLILLSSPISLALRLASTIAAAIQAKGSLLFLPQKDLTALESFPLLAVPLFILARSFLETGGVGRRLVNLANVMVRHFPGGLGMVMVATMIFSEVSGSSAGSRRPAARPLLLVMVAMLAVVGFIPEITLCVPRWVYGK